MEKRLLGKSAIKVSPIAFGGNVFGWTVDENTSFQLLDGFVDAGFNFIDTADVYSRWSPGHEGGESETIIGKWLKTKSRDKIILATKVGSDMGSGKKGLSKLYIKQAVEASLQRLQTDYIDLYQSHFEDVDTPQEETLQAFDELVKEGKVRIIGVSNHNGAKLVESLKISKEAGIASYQTLQPQYNLYEREHFEKEYKAICKEHNISVITYFSLASGFLTGKYRSEADFSKSKRGGGMKKYLNGRGMRILEALDKVSKETEATPAQVSLSWLINRPSVTAAIASCTNLEQLKEFSKAANLNLGINYIELLNEASRY